MKLSLLKPTDKLLNQSAVPVSVEEFGSSGLQETVDAMFLIAQGEQGDITKRTMVGLAAPQVGILKRIIIVDINATGLGEQPNLQAFINPEIIEESSETEEHREGCFSTGNICGIVTRSKQIKVKTFNFLGQVSEQEYQGFTARIFLHEIDHLNGVRFPDRISDPHNLHTVDSDEFGLYRVNWKSWTKYCHRQDWEAMKYGVQKFQQLR